MKTRSITSVCYVLVIAALYVLKVFLPEGWGLLPFDLLFTACCIIGTREILRAIGGEKCTSLQKYLVYGYSFVAVPLVFLTDILGKNALSFSLLLFVLFVAMALALLVIEFETATVEGTGIALFALVYPNLLMVVCSFINHIGVTSNSNIGILFLFVVCPFADAAAYLFGKLLHKKFPMKMAPKVSPNKSMVGGIGGILGGLVGALVVYFVYNAVSSVGMVNLTGVPDIVVVLAIGILGALLCEFGDLVESAIKRKVGIKDMGNLLPGHGGILDRFDGTMFTAIMILLLMAAISGGV